jgi:O-antigen/teichoic acid export membrane protein
MADGGNVKMRPADGPAKPSFLPRLGPKTIGFLWVARIGAAGAAFLTQILLGRGLGVEGYGALAVSLALVGFLLPLAGFGVPVFWLRVFGKEGQSARRWLRPTLILVAGSSVIVAAVAILLAFVVDLPSTSRTLVLVLSIAIPAQAVVSAAGSVLQLGSRYVALAICYALPYFARFLVAAVAVLLQGSSFAVAAGYSATATGMAVLYARELRHLVKRPPGGGNDEGKALADTVSTEPVPSLGRTLGQVWPFALSGFFYATYFQGSTALLGILGGEAEAGIFGAALSILSLGYLLPAVVFQQYLLPHLNRWLEHDRGRFVAAYPAGVDLMLATSLAFTGVAAGLGPWAMPFLFGAQFKASGPVLAVLALCFPIRFLASAAEATLLTESDMRYRVGCQCVGAAVAVIGGFLFVPRMGVWGAAIALIASEAAVLAGYLRGVRRRVLGGGALRTVVHGRLWAAPLGCALVVAGSLLFRGVHPAIGPLLAFAAVAISAWLTKGATHSKWLLG